MGGNEGLGEHDGGGKVQGHGSLVLKTRKDQAQALMILGLEAITETRSTGSRI